MIRTFFVAAVAIVAVSLTGSPATAACPELCNERGLCIEDVCVCDPGFAGDACEVTEAACPNACSGRGVCEFGKCFCKAGFTGPDCSDNVGVCPGGCGTFGTCVFDQCQCKLGWSGPQCSVPELGCPSDCSGHGICTDDGACACDAGYAGADCGTAVATCPANCSGRGVCKAGTCFCEPGFGGDACDKDNTCPNGCSGKGVCIAGTCACIQGFGGLDCSGECTLHCSNRGSCQDGTCSCEPGYEGAGCEAEKTCPKGCAGRGVCKFGQCFCNPGFEGESCDKPVACKGGCENGGLCQFGKCFCAPGFSGDNCKAEDGELLDAVTFVNPTFDAPVDVMVNILAKGAAPSIVISLADPLTGLEFQSTRHLLPANLINNGVVRSGGFSVGASVDGRDAGRAVPFYTVTVESVDPTDPGVVLIEFPVSVISSYLDQGTQDQALGIIKGLYKDDKKRLKAARAQGERLTKLLAHAGLGGMDAGVFADGSWAAAAERTLFASGFEDQGGTATVISFGVSVSEEEAWQLFLGSLPKDCFKSSGLGSPLGSYQGLIRSARCSPPGSGQIDYKPEKDLAPGVATFFATSVGGARRGGVVVDSGPTPWNGGIWSSGGTKLLGRSDDPNAGVTLDELAWRDSDEMYVLTPLGEGAGSPLAGLALPKGDPALTEVGLASGDGSGGVVAGKPRPLRPTGFVLIIDCPDGTTIYGVSGGRCLSRPGSRNAPPVGGWVAGNCGRTGAGPSAMFSCGEE